jgi:hypothetical protein
VRLPAIFREEEERLVEREAQELEAFQDEAVPPGDEVFLPYGFLSERAWTGFSSIR